MSAVTVRTSMRSTTSGHDASRCLCVVCAPQDHLSHRGKGVFIPSIKPAIVLSLPREEQSVESVGRLAVHLLGDVGVRSAVIAKVE